MHHGTLEGTSWSSWSSLLNVKIRKCWYKEVNSLAWCHYKMEAEPGPKLGLLASHPHCVCCMNRFPPVPWKTWTDSQVPCDTGNRSSVNVKGHRHLSQDGRPESFVPVVVFVNTA